MKYLGWILFIIGVMGLFFLNMAVTWVAIGEAIITDRYVYIMRVIEIGLTCVALACIGHRLVRNSERR